MIKQSSHDKLRLHFAGQVIRFRMEYGDKGMSLDMTKELGRHCVCIAFRYLYMLKSFTSYSGIQCFAWKARFTLASGLPCRSDM